MTHTQRIEELDIPACNDTDRLVSLDLGVIDKDDTITAAVEDEIFTGPVAGIDTYGETVDVECVIQFNMNYKHRIDGPDWEPWKGFLIEEPAGIYRLNVVLYNGEASRTRNCTGPSDITITRD